MINKKAFFKSLIVISLLIIIIVAVIQIRNTLARYETAATTERDVDVAFWVVDNSFQEERLLIEDIYPSTNPFEYTFTVSNFKDDKIAETDMEYEIVLTTTTNLPLSYEIQRNGTTYSNKQEEIYTDSDGTVYREIRFGTTENPYPLIMDTISNTTNTKTKVTDTYTIKVTFPQENSANLEYADLMEYIKIELTARQVI